MPRRAELVVDITLGDIRIPGGRVRIPAVVDGVPSGTGRPGAGTGTGTGRPSPNRTIYPPVRPPVAPPPPPTPRRIPFAPGPAGTWGRFASGFAPGMAGPLAIASIAITGLIMAFKALMAILSVLKTMLMAAAQALLFLARAFYGALAACVRFATAVQTALVRLATFAIQQSITALNLLVQKAVRAGRVLYELGARFVRSATTAFADFQQEIFNTVTVMGVFGPAATAMQQQVAGVAMEVSKWSRRTPQEIAKAAYDIASAGFSTVADLKALTQASVVLSEATLAALDQVSESLMATVNQFQMGAQGAMRAANAMAAVIALTPATMDKLTVSLKQCGTTAAQFGWSLEATLAALGGLFLVGHNGSIAGTEISNMFNSLVKMGGRAGAALTKVGLSASGMLEALKQGPAVLVAMVEGAERVHGRAAVTLAYQSAMTLRASRGLAGLMAVGSARLRDLQRQITGTNTAVQMQRDQMKSLAATWDRVKSTWERAKIGFGGGLAQTLTPALNVLIAFIDRLNTGGVFEFLGKLAGYVGGVVLDAFISLEPTLEWLAGFFGGFLGAALPRLAAAFASLAPSLAILAAQFALVAGALGTRLLNGVVALVPYLTALAGAFLDFVSAVGPQLIDFFVTLAEVLVTQILANKDLIIAWFTNLLNIGMQLVASLPALVPVVQQIVASLMALMQQAAALVFVHLPNLIATVQVLIGQFFAFEQRVLALVNGALGPFLAAVRFLATNGLPLIVSGLTWIINTALLLAPVIRDILGTAFMFFSGLLTEAGINGQSFGDMLYKVLAWIDTNFFDIIVGACDVLGLLITAFDALWVTGGGLGGAFLVLAGIIGDVLGVVVFALAGTCWLLQKAIIGIVEGWDMLTGGHHETWIKQAKKDADDLGNSLKTVGKMMILPWQALGYQFELTDKVDKASQAAQAGLVKMKAGATAAKAARTASGWKVPAPGAPLPPFTPGAAPVPGIAPVQPPAVVPVNWKVDPLKAGDLPAMPTVTIPTQYEAPGAATMATPPAALPPPTLTPYGARPPRSMAPGDLVARDMARNPNALSVFGPGRGFAPPAAPPPSIRFRPAETAAARPVAPVVRVLAPATSSSVTVNVNAPVYGVDDLQGTITDAIRKSDERKRGNDRLGVRRP